MTSALMQNLYILKLKTKTFDHKKIEDVVPNNNENRTNSNSK